MSREVVEVVADDRRGVSLDRLVFFLFVNVDMTLYVFLLRQ